MMGGAGFSARRKAGVFAVKAAVQPQPVLAFLLQMTTAGAFAGTLVAYHRRRKNPELDPFPIITRWSVATFVIGLGIALYSAVT
jgi:hypothetical protein